MISTQAVSYWLLPAQNDQEALEQLSALALQDVGACTLPPHITLHSETLDRDRGASHEHVIDRLKQLADCHQPVQLWPKAIEASPMYTQSLVLRFNAESRTALLSLTSQLCQGSTAEFRDRLDPHLSLVYSQDTLKRRLELARRLPLPEGPLRFERISAVTHPPSIRCPDDLAACITIHTCSLL